MKNIKLIELILNVNISCLHNYSSMFLFVNLVEYVNYYKSWFCVIEATVDILVKSILKTVYSANAWFEIR